ncbi:hypothetical protein SAMN04487819_105278 [Actinopolyspora alba]|uniref:HTH cro/C1-type domain-containing protein n=1 Tax=Actinopolyspora alba TaxID=673379 RepID=A0A1I1WI24_9ACTN|nr:transcriptional regulator [Actinopolyspora alba]SFD94732.1 hypothetical protein SAMN04487819_105278 [Actinopolyspora alba]
MARASAPRTQNSALIGLREDAGLSQDDLAEALNALAAKRHGKYPNVTKKTVGRWERGEVAWPQPFYRRLLAEFFDCASDELGFQRPRRTTDNAPTSDGELLPLVASPGTVDPRVDKDQQEWKDTRAVLGTFRRGLAVVAERLYPDSTVPGSEGSGVIAGTDWLPSVPVPLSELGLELDTDDSAVPAVDGSERQSAGVRPLASAEQRYHRYSHAVRDLAAPRLFENRLCFRLTALDLSQPNPRLRFGTMGFFDSIDTNEALGHEMAAHHLVRDRHGDLGVGRASWRRLAFRKHVGDPFDLSRRPLLGAIGTLTIRAGESPSMVLHQRDGGRVAGGGGMAHLLPAGIFQPSSVIPDAVRNDFSIWRNTQREFAEELLGHVEYDGSGRPIDYANREPFAGMDRARGEGRIRVYYLGVTLDALTLSGDILTVAVIEPDTYDELFGAAVTTNDEGRIPARHLPFEANTISRLHELGQLSPGASAAMNLAWQHRRALLDRN